MQKRLHLVWITMFLGCHLPSQHLGAGEPERFKEAQSIVESLAAKHSPVVRLTIHAVPTGERTSRIIASNVKEKIGKPSAHEDMEVMRTGRIVILKEGDNLDVTAPVPDKNGKPIAAAGITLRIAAGETEAEQIEKAKAIAKELGIAIQNAAKPLW